MTYALERLAIETYFDAEWTATPIGYDGHAFTPVADSIRLTIQPGQVLQGSTGRSLDRIDHVGALIIQIVTEGGLGSAGAREYVDSLMDLLFNVTLDEDGAPITTTAGAFLRFSPPQLSPAEHPYVSASMPDPPFYLTNITAPFVRYGYR